MKRIILVKSHNIVQLAHLYEHLFVMQLKDFMFERGLYKVIDYAVHGTTYDRSGIVEIDIELYSAEAIDLADQVARIRIDTDTNSLNFSSALKQIVAEESYRLHITDMDQVVESLAVMDDEPWTNFDDIGTIDTTKIRRRNDLIYLTDKTQTKPKVVKMECQPSKEFQKDHRNLLPLLNTLVRFVALTTTDILTKDNGFYAGDYYCQPKHQRYISELLVGLPYFEAVDIDDIMSTSRRIFEDITVADTIDRVVAELQNMSLNSHLLAVPDAERIEYETSVYIGSAGWREIATHENIDLILDSLYLRVRSGRSERQAKLNI